MFRQHINTKQTQHEPQSVLPEIYERGSLRMAPRDLETKKKSALGQLGWKWLPIELGKAKNSSEKLFFTKTQTKLGHVENGSCSVFFCVIVQTEPQIHEF